MGCDIHSFAERRKQDGQWELVPDIRPFGWRSYGMFGWLAGVRNYSALKPVAEGRELPADVSNPVKAAHDDWGWDAHSASWVSVAELLAVNYDAIIEDRRYTGMSSTGGLSGGLTCEEGAGERMSLREFLGRGFFEDLAKLQKLGAERVVFWFDN